ncbi:MAG: SDR family oxidoreductase [Bacteroidota bacterium]
MNVKGKTVLITGGTKGIGYGIAEILLRAGMKVAITSRSQSAADKAVAQLTVDTGTDHIIGIAADVRDLMSQKQAVEQLVNKWGQLDVLVANAGVGHFASIQEMTPQQWQDTIDVNLTGVFNSVKAGIEALATSKGYLITIASLAGTNFFAKGAAYNASKFGLVGFTQAVMLDLRQSGIKTTTIMPGSVATYFNNHQPDAEKDAWKIQPEDIGQMVLDLLNMPARTLPSKVEVRPSMPPSRG